MRLQDYIVSKTQDAAKEAFQYAKAVPQEKLLWKPLEAGRSVLDICRELALCPTWAMEAIEIKGGDYDYEEESKKHMEQIQREKEALKSVGECEAECNRRLEGFGAFLKNMTDEQLAETRWLPYGGGRDFTLAEIMEYPPWNFNYHLGQIAYIQMLYGDYEAH